MPGQQRDLDALQRATARQLDQAVQALSKAQTDPYAFADEVDKLLAEAHAQAIFHGRYKAGDTRPLDFLDTAAGDLAMDGQAEFLAAFRADLVNGKYDGAAGLRVAQVAQRARMYLGAVTGSANRAMTEALDPERGWIWVLGAAEQHCRDCPRIAAGSPYRAEELPAHPGDGSTQCKNFCRCQLKSGRRRGFRTTRLKK